MLLFGRTCILKLSKEQIKCKKRPKFRGFEQDKFLPEDLFCFSEFRLAGLRISFRDDQNKSNSELIFNGPIRNSSLAKF